MTRPAVAVAVSVVLAAAVAAPANAAGARPVASVEVDMFTGHYATGVPDDPKTPEDESRRTQKGYIGLYREGLVACNGSAERFPSPSETIGAGPYTMQGYMWIGRPLASTNQTAGRQLWNLAGAGNNHRTDATATGRPTGEAPCPEEDPDAVND